MRIPSALTMALLAPTLTQRFLTAPYCWSNWNNMVHVLLPFSITTRKKYIVTNGIRNKYSACFHGQNLDDLASTVLYSLTGSLELPKKVQNLPGSIQWWSWREITSHGVVLINGESKRDKERGTCTVQDTWKKQKKMHNTITEKLYDGLFTELRVTKALS